MITLPSGSQPADLALRAIRSLQQELAPLRAACAKAEAMQGGYSLAASVAAGVGLALLLLPLVFLAAAKGGESAGVVALYSCGCLGFAVCAALFFGFEGHGIARQRAIQDAEDELFAKISQVELQGGDLGYLQRFAAYTGAPNRVRHVLLVKRWMFVGLLTRESLLAYCEALDVLAEGIDLALRGPAPTAGDPGPEFATMVVRVLSPTAGAVDTI